MFVSEKVSILSHDYQRQAAGEQAGLEAHGLGEDQHTHEAVDDAGDARQRLIRELDDLNEFWREGRCEECKSS